MVCVGMRVIESLVFLYTELRELGGLNELSFLLEHSEALWEWARFGVCGSFDMGLVVGFIW